MGLTASAFYCLIFLLGLVSCSAEVVDDLSLQKLLLSGRTLLSEMDVVTPTTTVPVINPTYPPTTTTPVYNPFPPAISSPTTPTMTPITNPPSTPTMVTPSPPSSSSGQSWCVASQSASQTALQVALDYACGYGGADCSAIQQGGSCFNPDTLRDHASYAFNDYYQKNPIPTSCDFGGTAAVTSVDPNINVAIACYSNYELVATEKRQKEKHKSNCKKPLENTFQRLGKY
ncbi:glucan endo-1,3-beta-glucosidase 12-like [Canna indica]|uniref:Glucan endo-1,3-beta-glucosidase 12-like n=1 Tax=Canna indica TaxID=4628 RepID=A0AAQ3JL08_9LILI|nr:glucan endo-1,3-beta-glucosidase 12-like [Canna indica]